MIGKSLKTAWIQSKTLSPNNKTKPLKDPRKYLLNLPCQVLGELGRQWGDKEALSSSWGSLIFWSGKTDNNQVDAKTALGRGGAHL